MILITMCVIICIYSMFKMCACQDEKEALENGSGSHVFLIFICVGVVMHSAFGPAWGLGLAILFVYFWLNFVGWLLKTKAAIKKYNDKDMGPKGWRLWAAVVINNFA